jgi:hypothetical protein
MTFALVFAVAAGCFFLACSDGAAPGNAPPGAGAGGKSSGGGDGGTGGMGGHAGGGTGGGAPGTCPATAPSGACSDPSLTCHYVDAEGCPQVFDCFDYLGSKSWTPRIPQPIGPCSNPGQVCIYEEAIGDNHPVYGALKCGTSGMWGQGSVCPASIPNAGESCAYPFLNCSYMACGRVLLAYCNGPTSGWAVESCPDAGP